MSDMHSEINFRRKITALRPFGKPEDTRVDNPEKLQLALESDRGRIINSAAIRRLQQKTQVFPLERNAAVRSRLTHSMEVQQVGRFIAQKIFKLLGQDAERWGLQYLERQLETLVEMSCLMHDVGNPPFGHFGEAAISDWFKRNLVSLAPSGFDSGYPELIQDLSHFEGNAQGIRLIHTLLGLNLTYSQLAGILKYTRPGTLVKDKANPEQSYLMKKVGYYASESRFVAELTQAMEMAPGCRHPVSYIMEAADDISYCLADIEDAVEKGIIELDTLKQSLIAEYQRQIAVKQGALGHKDFMSKSIEAADSSARHLAINQQSQFFNFLRVRLIHPLVNHAAKRFIDNIEAVYHGNLNESLLEDGGYEHAITETLKQVAIKQVFCHREVEKLELQGYRIITGLLDNYRSLLALSEDEFSKLVQGLPKTALIETRLFHKLPGKHLATYKRAIEANQYPEFYHRCRLLQDYISGMTDQYALDEYRLLMVLD